jgi:RNA polymerase sigma-70 factor (ECF subfamily)
MSSSIIDFTTQAEAEGLVSFGVPADDDTLVLAARNGNEQAFEILVKRHRRKILSVALGFTRVQEDAEDIAQQSLQKAFVHLRTFEGKSSFSTWLTRIAINESLMFLRKGRSQREVSIDEDSADLEGAAQRWEIPDSSPDPEATYLKQEEGRILSVAMNTLRPGLRKAIELRHLGELSTEETARRMGASVGATKSNVLRGRRKLREALKRCVRSPRMAGRIAADATRMSRGPLACAACD